MFHKEGMNPVDAANGFFAMESWDDAGFPDDGDDAMTEEEGRGADIWLEATKAAVKACCSTWTDPPMPFTDSLELVLTPEEKEGL